MDYLNYPYGHGLIHGNSHEDFLRQTQFPGGGQQQPPGPPPQSGVQHMPPHGGSQHQPPHGGFPPPPPQHGGGHQPPFGGGQHGGPPTVPPPAFIPHEQVGLYAVDPGGIRPCLYRYTYIWLRSGKNFWYYPTYVGRTSIAGYRWRGNHWQYYGMDLDRIRSFTCH
ncbi:transporter [Neobacillus sp. NRS-1170]|uniref:transporter n=1 Tax=Neobacillus sp. NRS-1170 TaxID=3233898 RepID=UPI003D2D5CC5